MKLFLTSIFCFYTSFFFGQAGNPFDIPVTNNETPVSSPLTAPGQIEGQISDSLDISDNSPFQEIIEDTSSTFISGVEDSLQQSGASSKDGNNPFDIGLRNEPPSKNTPPDKTSTPGPGILAKAGPEDTKIIALVYSVVMLIILTLAISMDRKKFGFMVQSCINSNNLRTLYRDNKAWTNGQSIVLYVFFFLNLAFVIWFLNIKMSIFPDLDLFLILGALVLCYLLRHLVMWSLGNIFPLGQEVGLHNFSISLHNMVLGVFLLPFILALEFMPSVGYKTMFYGVLFIILLLYILRQTKGLLLSFGMRGFNLFYFFVYLCAVEIAPILVVYKMISGAL